MKRREALNALGIAGLWGASGQWAAYAQGTTAAKVLVGAPPGGGTDILARALTNEMGKALSRTLVVENKPGAGGNIAALGVAKSAPDSSTLLLSYTSHVINPALYKKAPFDPVGDFTPIAPIARAPAILVVAGNFPANTLPELIAMAKARPGSLNVAIAGLGGANHLAGEMLRKKAGIDVIGVPYKGTASALTDMMGGQVDIVFSGYGAAGALIKAGKLKALGVTSAKPLAELPGVPPIANVLPGFDYSAWYGLFGPAGMSAADVAALQKAVHQSLQSPQLQAQLKKEGMESMEMSAPEFRSFITAEVARWKDAVAASGMAQI